MGQVGRSGLCCALLATGMLLAALATAVSDDDIDAITDSSSTAIACADVAVDADGLLIDVAMMLVQQASHAPIGAALCDHPIHAAPARNAEILLCRINC